MAPPAKRGAVIGKVMAGLLCGILLSRTLAGFVPTMPDGGRCSGWACRWRALGSCLRILLPTSRADHHHSYGSLLASLVHLWRDLPACAARR
jgi:hypothetical protein